MLKKSTLVLMLVALLLVVAACSSSNNNAPAPTNEGQPSPTATTPAATNNADEAAAMSVYKGNCMACHATDLAGSGSFPNLQKVGAKYSESQISDIIHNGRGGMPAFKGKLSEEEITTLATWLSEKK